MWEIKQSDIHAKGLFASQNINRGVKIIEYKGEKISKKEGDRRSEKRLKKYLNSKSAGSVYIFELNNKYDIDGSFAYNKAKYINHSCSPNCEVQIEKGKIWIVSTKKIKKGAEFSYDYGYEFDKDDYMDHLCECGKPNCIGYIISSDDWHKYKKFVKKKKKLK